MPAPLELRVKPVDSPWETVGVDRYAGIEVEGFTADADADGPATCSFTLKRPVGVGAAFPDLAAFTDCEVRIAGRLVWEGRVREAPTSTDPDEVAVAGVGWQVELDDDQYLATYVETDLGRWRDVRSLLTSDLTKFRTAPTVLADGGALVLTFPNGFATATGDAVGALIDLGPDPRQWVKRISLLAEHTGNGHGNVELRCVGHDTEVQAYAGGENAFAATLTNALSAPTGNPATGTTKAGTTADYHRFFTVLLYYNGGAGTFGADYGVKVKAALLAREAAYEAAGASTLKASTVYSDALDQCCPLLSRDRSLIQATTYSLPEWAPDGPQTARAARDAVNAPHRWRTRIRPGRVPEFAPQPNAPLVAVGDWGASKFRDASAGSGDELANRVLATGTGPDGTNLAVERTSGSAPAAKRLVRVATALPLTAQQVDAIDTADTVRRGRRVTFIVDALNVDQQCEFILRMGLSTPSGSAGPLEYVEFYVKAPAAGAIALPVAAKSLAASSDWGFTYLELVGIADPFGATVTMTLRTTIGTTLIDRRGFTKTTTLPIDSTLTADLGAKLGDAKLAAAARTPLKGTLEVGVGGARRVGAADKPTATSSPVAAAGGDDVHPSELLMMTTDLVRLSNLVDPDTGAQHRDAIMATVGYVHDAEISTVAVDNDRAAIGAVIARMAAVRR